MDGNLRQTPHSTDSPESVKFIFEMVRLPAAGRPWVVQTRQVSPASQGCTGAQRRSARQQTRDKNCHLRLVKRGVF